MRDPEELGKRAFSLGGVKAGKRRQKDLKKRPHLAPLSLSGFTSPPRTCEPHPIEAGS